jgi:ketosteroid isomerase-like protein
MNTAVPQVSKQAEPSKADPASAAAKFAERLLSNDCERLVREFYSEGARFVPPDSHPIVGRDPIRRHWTGVVKDGLTGADIRVSRVECAGREAVGLGRYTLIFESEGRRETGAFFVRYRRQGDGSWKAAEHVFHSDTTA